MKKISLIGINYDEKSSYLKGSAQAPDYVRGSFQSNSSNSYSEKGTDIDHDLIIDNGNFIPKEYLEIEEIIDNQMKINDRILTLGGDHSITYPIIRSYQKYYPEIQILHIDAHADLYDEFEGDRYSHACPFARIMEEGLTGRLVQLGIRTLTKHQREQIKKYGIETMEMKNFNLSKVPKFYKPVYISLDMDALDPAFAPGVSHYEPGGFSTRQLIQIIQRINVPVIGADIVEYNPLRDIQGITSMVAAKLMKEILSRMLEL